MKAEVIRKYRTGVAGRRTRPSLRARWIRKNVLGRKEKKQPLVERDTGHYMLVLATAVTGTLWLALITCLATSLNIPF